MLELKIERPHSVAKLLGGRKMKRLYSEKDARVQIETFRQEADTATGKNGSRATFKQFRLLDEVKLAFEEGVNLFVAGDYTGSYIQVGRAREALVKKLVGFCKGSLEGLFSPATEELRLRGIDQDIMAGIEKRRKTFEVALAFLLVDPKANMRQASEAHWDLREAIEQAPRDQVAREEHRARLAEAELSRKQKEKIAARKKKDEEAAEASRLRQRLLAEEGKGKRNSFANEMLAGL